MVLADDLFDNDGFRLRRGARISTYSMNGALGPCAPHTCTLSTHVDVMASILVLVIPGGFRACRDCRSVSNSSIAAMSRLGAPEQCDRQVEQLSCLGDADKGIMCEEP